MVESKRARVISSAAGLTVVAVLALSAAGRQTEVSQRYRSEMEQADRTIEAEVRAHSELIRNLDYLTSHIGARLTGTAQMEAAAKWAAQRFRDYGISVRVETMMIAHAWYRGDDTAELLAPMPRKLEIRSVGWSKATPGPIIAPVVYLEDPSPEMVAAKKAWLAGAIVLLGKPTATLQPIADAENAYDAVVPRTRAPQTQRARAADVAAAGAAVFLLDSGKVDSLINMGTAGPAYEPTALPAAFITHEDYSLIARLARDGTVRMKVNLAGKFSPGKQPASLVWAEIGGAARSSERVIIGGHLDSWDLGQGALDNGTGAMAVLEAARTLKALGWSPQRTLTFMLFPGEEQGLRGSRWYVEQHGTELPSIDAMLVHDTGTGRVNSIALEGLDDTASLMRRVYEPLQAVFRLQSLSTRTFTGSDHVPFLEAGVPAYFCVQSPARYGEAHHSQTDTFDKVIADEVNQGAAVLAAWAWNVSELAERIPRKER